MTAAPSTWIQAIELTLRWALGLQFVFWGLNGFFHWKPIPRSEDFITRFADACHDGRFILPTVKLFEIIFGGLLLTGFATLISLLMLGPIVFVISGLHLFHNPKSWQVILPITAPYLLLCFLTRDLFVRLLLS